MGKRRKTEIGCVELAENALQLLRSATLSTWLHYYLGAVPFILGLLFFITDMSTSAYAEGHCVMAALGMALLYIWMRFWQSRFCKKLLAMEGFSAPADCTGRTFLHELRFHLITSTRAIVLYPIALALLLPKPWASAYINSLCMVDTTQHTVREASNKAWAAARIQPIQNMYVHVILFLFGFVVALNLTLVGSMLPGLLKSLLGIETPLTHHFYWIFNSTFIGTVLGLTYLLVDPLMKAVYVLRFSAFDSMPTGRDILLELSRLPAKRRTAGVARLGLILLLLSGAMTTRAEAEEPAPNSPVQAEELDRSLNQTMKEREFAWRMPREQQQRDPSEEESLLERWNRSIEEFFERLFKRREKKVDLQEERSSEKKTIPIKDVMWILLILLIGGGIAFIIASFRRKNLPVAEQLPTQERPQLAEMDLDDANLTATLLEEDEWIQLARSLAEAGELRKAIRAWFLAGLAYLARVNLLTVKPAKTNRDYRRELTRRARRRPMLVPAFSEHVERFERIWYGLHTVLPDDIDEMEVTMERMRNDEQE